MSATGNQRDRFYQGQTTIASALEAAGRAFSIADLRPIRLATVGTGIPESAFLELLVETGLLEPVELTSDRYTGFKRYVRPGTSGFEVALSLRRNSYLSHGTAVFLHGLTDQAPARLYVNREQSPKPEPEGNLNQVAIDRAFAARQREAAYILSTPGYEVVLLSGKATGNLEVGEIVGPSGETLTATKLERTLIDIAVRPAYAGGLFQVLQAYRGAIGRASVGALLSTLQKLNYVYPYHQAIGFYMERAGFDEKLLKRVEAIGMKFDFYLAHGIRRTVRSVRWRLFHPEGL